jgi:hypothetical protein
MSHKFEGATEEELAEYVAKSAQTSTETDVEWAHRVQRLESDLLARIELRQATAAATPAPEA